MTDLSLDPEVARATDELTAEVVASFDRAPERLRQLSQSLVSHLHAFVMENDLTDAEWRFAIDFLTRAGHITTTGAREFVLLSTRSGCPAWSTSSPTPAPPTRRRRRCSGRSTSRARPRCRTAPTSRWVTPEGDPTYADITVTDVAGGRWPGRVVDVWQANEDGFYDVQLPELEGPVLRARLADRRRRPPRLLDDPARALPDPRRWTCRGRCSPRSDATRCGRPTCTS